MRGEDPGPPRTDSRKWGGEDAGSRFPHSPAAPKAVEPARTMRTPIATAAWAPRSGTAAPAARQKAQLRPTTSMMMAIDAYRAEFKTFSWGRIDSMVLATFVMRLMEAMFFLGLVGSAVVVIISFVEDGKELFGRD